MRDCPVWERGGWEMWRQKNFWRPSPGHILGSWMEAASLAAQKCVSETLQGISRSVNAWGVRSGPGRMDSALPASGGGLMRFPRLLAISLLLTSACLVLSTGILLARQHVPGGTMVYVTRTGAKYHQAGCSSLSRSAIPMRLDKAALRYGPCGRCRPPVWQPSAAGSAEPLPAPPPAPVAGVAAPEVFLAVGGSGYHLDRNCKGLVGRQTVTRRN